MRDANSYLQHVGPSSLVIEPGFPALGAQSFTHWTTREVPEMIHFKWKTHSPRYQCVLINGTEFLGHSDIYTEVAIYSIHLRKNKYLFIFLNFTFLGVD